MYWITAQTQLLIKVTEKLLMKSILRAWNVTMQRLCGSVKALIINWMWRQRFPQRSLMRFYALVFHDCFMLGLMTCKTTIWPNSLPAYAATHVNRVETPGNRSSSLDWQWGASVALRSGVYLSACKDNRGSWRLGSVGDSDPLRRRLQGRQSRARCDHITSY